MPGSTKRPPGPATRRRAGWRGRCCRTWRMNWHSSGSRWGARAAQRSAAGEQDRAGSRQPAGWPRRLCHGPRSRHHRRANCSCCRLQIAIEKSVAAATVGHLEAAALRLSSAKEEWESRQDEDSRAKERATEVRLRGCLPAAARHLFWPSGSCLHDETGWRTSCILRGRRGCRC